jgi:MFS family permease
METIAVGVLVTQTTGQAQWTGIVAAAGFVPMAFVGPVGGALADRMPRHRLLVTTTVIQTMFAGTLTALAALGTTPPWAVTLIVFGSGCASAAGLPAYQALLPELVGRDDLPGAIALGSAQWNLGRVIGPVLAGVAITAGGYTWAFAINTVSFLAVIAAVAPLHLPTPARHDGVSIIASIRRGARFVIDEPGTRAVMTYLALFAFFAAPFIALVPAVALKLFGDERRGTAALVTAQGLGAVVMALMLGGIAARFGYRRVLLVAVGALPVTLVLYALAPSLTFGVVAICLVGATYLGCLSTVMTITQLRAPGALRGRVMATGMLILGTLYPLGSIAQGAVADQVGLRVTTAGGAVVLAALLVALRVFRPGFDDVLRDNDPSWTAADESGPDRAALEVGT